MVDVTPPTFPSIGPLTTIFTPPATCFSIVQAIPAELGMFWMGRKPSQQTDARANDVDLDCYPPGYATEDAAAWFAYYEPGICPAGWTSACKPPKTTSDSTNTAPLPYFTSPTIGHQCCPSSYNCDANYEPFVWCTSYFTSASISALVYDVSTTGFDSDNQPLVTTTSSLVLTANTNQWVRVRPVFVAYVSSPPTAAPTGVTASTSGSETAPTGSGASSASASSPGSSTHTAAPSSGLSTGGKIAVGVGIPLGVIAILLAALVFLLWKRHQKNNAAPMIQYHQGREYRTELPTKEREISELPARSHQPVELPDHY